MTEEINRFVAYKVHIMDVLNSQFTDGTLKWNNYLLGRVNIIGTVISLQNKDSYKNVFIDDGTGSIALRLFEAGEIPYKIGDAIQVIGRPRMFGQERYVSPEITKKIDAKWIPVRKKEIELFLKYLPMVKIQQPNTEKMSQTSEETFKLIKEFDKDGGVEIEFLINQGIAEEMIYSLIADGFIFEISPGKVKVLE